MMAMPQPYSPHPGNLQQHPGMAGGGHPMAPGHPHGSQQGQAGMPQQMHMGVSGPGGPQVSQPGVSMGMQPGGAGIPGGPSAHALQHLNPNQTQMYQQQQMAFNPQFQQQMAQQQMIQQQQQQRQQHALRQAQAMQQYANGMPMTMPNGLNPNMSQAQFNAMRGAVPQNMRPVVALPQHLQAQQLQAQQGLEQQQAQQAAAQQQHQQMLAQQMAMQNAQSQAGNNPLQQNMSPQQMQNLQNAQLAAQQQQQQQAQQQQQQAQQQAQQQQQQQAQQAAQQQQQQQAAAAAAQQSQNQSQPQPPPQQNQQSQQNQQPQQPAPQPQTQPPQQQQQQPNLQQQQAAAGAAMMQNRSRDSIKGHCILLLKQFGDHLSMFAQFTHPVEHYMSEGATRLEAQDQKQHADVGYWTGFVQRFFSPIGVYRHSILDHKELKDYQITVPALTRYFYTHFESGIKNMQLITEKASEKELPNHYYFLESPKASFIYWFDNGSHLVATGTLRAQFDPNQKIEMLEFITSSHEEYVPRTSVVEAIRPLHEWQKEWQKVNAPPDGKQSPETSKKAKPRPLKSPPNAPPEIELPDSKVKRNMGITPSVFRFLELAEVMGQMNPLFGFSHQNTALAPYAALDQYVANISATNGQNQQGMNPGLAQPGQRTPGVNQFNMNQSPATGNMSLPDGGGMMGSPAQGHMQAPGMSLQQSQQGTSSSGPSANTSPNNNKRRRPSVKAESDTDGGIGQQPNGVPAKGKVNPSPRIGGKRQKGNPA